MIFRLVSRVGTTGAAFAALASVNLVVLWWLSDVDRASDSGQVRAGQRWQPLTSTELRHGTAWVGDTAAFSATVTNTTSEPVRITDISTTSLCTDVKANETLLRPFAQTQLSGMIRGSADPGTVAQFVELQLAGTETERRDIFRIPVEAQFLATVDVDFEASDNGEIVDGGAFSLGSLTIRNVSNSEVHVAIAQEHGDMLTVSPSSATITSGESAVAFISTHHARNSVEVVRVIVDSGREVHLLPISLQSPGASLPEPKALVLGIISGGGASLFEDVNPVIAIRGPIVSRSDVVLESVPDVLKVAKHSRTDRDEMTFEFEVATNKVKSRSGDSLKFSLVNDEGDIVQSLTVPVVWVFD